MMKIVSPLTLQNTVKKEFEIPVQKIIALYRDKYAISVDKYFIGVDNISVYKCMASGLMFYHPLAVGDSFFYEELQKLGWYYPNWKWENQYVASFIKPEAEVLEIGCGDGHFLSRMQSDKKIIPTGIELNLQAAQNLRQKGIEVISETVEEYAKANKKKFDVVCCFQVLEHVPNIQEFIESCLSLLKIGGVLAFAVPNNVPFLYGYDVYHALNLPPHHQSLWNKETFSKIPFIFKNIYPVSIQADPIDIGQFQAYMKFYKESFGKEKLSYWFVKRFVPKKFWHLAAKLLKTEGRNIVAVYCKKG